MNRALALTSSSHQVIGAALPPQAVNDNDYVGLSIAYNAFDLKEVDEHELQWREDATVSDYLEGLPEEAEWGLFINGEPCELEDVAERKLQRLDRIALILIPQGGGGGLKKILMAVVAVAAIVVGAFVPGMQWLIPVGVSMLVGMATMMLMMPKKPKSGNDDDQTYGLDGAKNSATEGIVYPVVYGDFRIGGNFCDCYTQNVGENQYLYLRTVLNDGEIFDALDVELNEQPLSNFKDVQYRLHKGTLTEPVNDWFPASIVQINKAAKLDTTWTTHLTTGPVDRVRFDIVFSEGLTKIDKKHGDKEPLSVGLECQYRKVGDTTWSQLPLSTGGGGYTTGTLPPFMTIFLKAIQVKVASKTAVAAQTPQTVKAVNVDTGEEHILGVVTPTEEEQGGYVFDASGSGALAGNTNVTPMVTRTFSADLPAGNYTVVTDMATNVWEVIENHGNKVLASESYNSSGKVTFMDHRTVPIRRSISSATLPRGQYEVRIRRTTAEDTRDEYIDTVMLTDVAEIDNTPVALRGTANLSLRIKLNDQLNGIPQLTCRVKSMCRRYDIDGNVIDIVPTSNPAWIGLDILLSPERGALISPSRIDWPRWVEFAQWCDDNNIQFNGAFAESSNVGDALRQVLRIGQAVPVPFGTKISVAIDRPRDPVHVFTQGSIIKDSFQITYLSMQDRANEYEFTYYDKTDRNKAKTIRYVDPQAVQFNETPRTANLSFVGVDNIEQARRELWKAIYQNRLIIRQIQFDSWLDSINMTLGEVALIQHDMMDWANSGRLAAGSTSLVLNLDQKVTLNGDSSALVHFDALQRATVTVNAVAGKSLIVNRPNDLDFTDEQLNSKRLIVGGEDYEIASITNGTSYHTILLTNAPTGIASGATAELWDTDVVIETPVSGVTQNADGTSSLTLTTPLPDAPNEFANFAFGPVISVKKPYVLSGVSGNGLEKRKLSFIEYDERVYGPAEVELPVPVIIGSDRAVSQVQAIMLGFDQIVEAGRGLIPVNLKWSSGHILNYGGADIFVSINGEALQPAGSAMNTNQYQIQVKPGDRVLFMMVAFNQRGDRAPVTSAPSIGATIDVLYADLDPPTNVNVTDVHFEVDGKVAVNFTPPADMTGVSNYEVQYKRSIDANWTSVGFTGDSPVEIAGLPTGNYTARVRSANGSSTSLWVEDDFTVVVTPGSLMENWLSSNDRNGDPILAPTLPETGAVEHTLNADGSANVSMEWLWDGDEATIDGFEITITNQHPPSP
jgi:hypothetical protein